MFGNNIRTTLDIKCGSLGKPHFRTYTCVAVHPNTYLLNLQILSQDRFQVLTYFHLPGLSYALAKFCLQFLPFFISGHKKKLSSDLQTVTSFRDNLFKGMNDTILHRGTNVGFRHLVN